MPTNINVSHGDVVDIHSKNAHFNGHTLTQCANSSLSVLIGDGQASDDDEPSSKVCFRSWTPRPGRQNSGGISLDGSEEEVNSEAENLSKAAVSPCSYRLYDVVQHKQCIRGPKIESPGRSFPEQSLDT